MYISRYSIDLFLDQYCTMFIGIADNLEKCVMEKDTN